MKLWSLMERECHKLDLELAHQTRGQTGDRESFQKYSHTIHKLGELEEEREKAEHYSRTLDGAVTSIALQLNDAQNSPLLFELRKEALRARKQLENVVYFINCLKYHNKLFYYLFHQERITEKECQEEFDIEDGPFCRALDNALASFKVCREAYYGGTFTGNHAHKCLKVGNNIYCMLPTTCKMLVNTQEVNINILCLSITTTAEERCEDMLPKARDVAQQFQKIFTLFSECHTVYSGRTNLTDQDLADLGKKTC